jgi:CRISPR/Cas system-associated exonuclease Cas4 (RecB family)
MRARGEADASRMRAGCEPDALWSEPSGERVAARRAHRRGGERRRNAEKRPVEPHSVLVSILVASLRALAHAPWSASKVQTALRCPRLFHYRYVEKIDEPETLPEARVGKAVHAALEHVLQGKSLEEAVAEARKQLEDDRETARFDSLGAGIQAFIGRMGQFRRRRRVQRELVEYTLAVREDVTATQFYSADAFYRGIVDAAFIFDDDSLAVVDHKTGERRPQHTIGEQLQGYAVLAAAAFRNVRRIWLGVHWVADHVVEWAAPVTVSEIQSRFVPAVLHNIEAAALAADGGPRPNPGAWCEWCTYRSICPAAIEMRFEPVDEEPEPWH